LTKTLKRRQTVIGSPYWMAPEVITAGDSSSYDEKADIWSVGITAIEMAECAPPHYDLHPMNALFIIPTSKAPTLTKKSKWSKEFNDFVSQSVNKNVKKRADAKTLLQVMTDTLNCPLSFGPYLRIPSQHPFILGAKQSTTVLAEVVDRYLQAKSQARRPGQAKGEDQSDGEEPATPKETDTVSNDVEKSLLNMGFPPHLVKEALHLYVRGHF